MPDVAVLTDGTAVSPGTPMKFFKDFVADFLLTAASTITVANILSLQDAVQGPQVAGFAIASALIRAGYRAALRWATS